MLQFLCYSCYIRHIYQKRPKDLIEVGRNVAVSVLFVLRQTHPLTPTVPHRKTRQRRKRETRGEESKTQTDRQTHTHTHTHARMHAHTHARTHTHTHTHTKSLQTKPSSTAVNQQSRPQSAYSD